MHELLKSSLLAASISAVSLTASAGIDFTLVADTGPASSTMFGPNPEVANNSTVLFSTGSGIQQVWKKSEGISTLPGYNQTSFSLGHMSNNGDYFMFPGRDRWYNYHTPDGVVQRGMTGFSGRIIRQTSGDGDKLLAFSGGEGVGFYEHGGRNETVNPRAADYSVFFDLPGTESVRMPYYDSISNDGNRFIVSQGSTGYFIDVPDSAEPGAGSGRTGEVTPLPFDISYLNAMSDDGSTVIGRVPTQTEGCNYSFFHYHETEGYTDLGCTDDFNAIGVSGDGSKVIGIDRNTNEAVIWDKINGTRDIRALLLSAGYDISDWSAIDVSDISEDGTKIVGWGVDGDGNGQVYLIESVPECNVSF